MYLLKTLGKLCGVKKTLSPEQWSLGPLALTSGLQSSTESGHRVDYDEAKRRQGNIVHLAIAMLGRLLVLHAVPANDRHD